MSRALSVGFAVTLLLIAAGCNTSTAPNNSTAASGLSSAFASLPVGFPFVPSTFAGGAAADSSGWSPPDSGDIERMGPGRGDDDGDLEDGGHDGGAMMCGGLGGAFGGEGLGFGFGFGRGLFGGVFAGTALPGTCAFDATSGRVVCDPITRDGLTIVRSAAYTDANGAVQQGFDSLTTNTINLRVSVTGTKVHRDNDTSTVRHASDRTVSGLAPSSTRRTVNGTSAGLENINGTSNKGSFTAVRTIGDTITGVVIPVSTTGPTYPMAGSIVRSASVTVTFAGQSPTTSSRREVVTFDGTSTAKVVITRDGVTKNCTIALPHGRLVCA